MTLGLAVAAWVASDEPAVFLASDTRLMSEGSVLTDTGIKIYDLGGCAAMVAAGNAIPALTAAEIVRPIIENHNRRDPSRKISFVDTCRLAAFFLKRSAEQQHGSCETVVAGFLASGTPALSQIIISPLGNFAAFFECEPSSFIAVPVGADDGKRLLTRGLSAAKRDGRKRIESAVGLVWYMINHPGAFPTVGGTVSVGTCEPHSESFSWPIIGIGGHHFLRGVDVTQFYRPSWPSAITISYDESWCSKIDQEVATDPQSGFAIASKYTRYDIDSWFTNPETLFQMHDDPPGFELGLPRKN